MDELVALLNSPWGWMAGGLALILLEMLAPGVFLLWLGIAAAATGMLTFGLGLTLPWQLASFAMLSFVSVIIGRRYFRRHPGMPTFTEVNMPGTRYVGRVVNVVEAITGGRGRVRVADSPWLAEGPDAPVGSQVRIIAVDGSVLKVEPIEPESVAPALPSS